MCPSLLDDQNKNRETDLFSIVLNQIVNLVILMILVKLFGEMHILDRFGFAYVKKILQKHVLTSL